MIRYAAVALLAMTVAAFGQAVLHFPDDQTLVLGVSGVELQMAWAPGDPNCVGSSVFYGNGGRHITCGVFPDLTGKYVVAVGQRALTNMTSGSYNVAMGYEAGENCLNCTRNTMIGEAAGIYHEHETDMTALGWKACLGSPTGPDTGNWNTCIGAGSMIAGTDNWRDTAVGNYSLGNPLFTGDDVIGIGNTAGYLCINCQRSIFVGTMGANVSDSILIGDVGTIGNNNTIALGTGGKPRFICDATSCRIMSPNGMTVLAHWP